MRFREARLSSYQRALAAFVLCLAVAGAVAWPSIANGQTPFDPKNPLAQLAKCALGEEESRSAIVRDVPSQFSAIPGESRNGIQGKVQIGAETPAL
jgi:hypothetical protein